MRKQNESIIINNNIELTVVEIKGKSVKLGFTFPKGASVLRKELYEKIMEENMAAASSSTGELSQDEMSALGKISINNNQQSDPSDTDK
jgi:carbon storage regulator